MYSSDTVGRSGDNPEMVLSSVFLAGQVVLDSDGSCALSSFFLSVWGCVKCRYSHISFGNVSIYTVDILLSQLMLSDDSLLFFLV